MKKTNGQNNSVISFFASRSLSPADLFAAVCTAFVIASVVFLCGGNFTELTYVRQYPWWLHGLLTLGAWVLTTLLRTLPYRRLCKNSVIGTIKGLERGE